MHAISKNRHGNLKHALLQMESLLAGRNRECGYLQQATDYNRELETMYQNYERLLDELARQIDAYEILYSEVKVQFLGKKLKELKKEISIDQPAFSHLVTNIHLIYST